MTRTQKKPTALLVVALLALVALSALLAPRAGPRITMDGLMPHLAAHPDVLAATGPNPSFQMTGVAEGGSTFDSTASVHYYARGESGEANVVAIFRGFLRSELTLREVRVSAVPGERAPPPKDASTLPQK